tara:strand:- start:304 stop:879 length:576 start_codon:yes stop_codon:yes gene_type:complete
MNQDNVLKKEFAKKDVERLRNLMQGKYGDKTQTSVGYTKKEEFHKEGDIWEEDDRKWTIQNGIKQNVTKLDSAKKAHMVPLLCPNCKKVMKNRNDSTYYKVHKTCFRCVILKEEKLKKEGKWDEYHNGIINNEIDNKIKDFKLWVEDKLLESNSSHVSEAGDVERWVGKVNKEKVDENIKNVVEYLESLKK